MISSGEIAAWLDLADYARELSDTVSDQPAKRAMLRIAKFCEVLAFRHPDAYASSPGNWGSSLCGAVAEALIHQQPLRGIEVK